MSLKFVVLTLLNQHPQTGYDIVKSFDQSLGYFWSASHQQVYRELANLSKAGWVSYKEKLQADKPDKKIYQISRDGRTALIEWAASSTPAGPTRETLLVKMLSADAIGIEALQQQLTAQKAKSEATLNTYLGIETDIYSPPPNSTSPATDRMLFLALRKGILAERCHLLWLDEALEMIGGS